MGIGVLMGLVIFVAGAEPRGESGRTVPSTVSVAGCLANWDADADDDGIRAVVVLSTRGGRPVAISPGWQATFTLRPVPTRSGFKIERDLTDPAFLAPPIRWTVRLRQGPGPQVVRLPWRVPPPAVTRGRLEVRLSAPTHGVFVARTIVRLDVAGIP